MTTVHQIARTLVHNGHAIAGSARIAAELLKLGVDVDRCEVWEDVGGDFVVLPGYQAGDDEMGVVDYPDEDPETAKPREIAQDFVDGGSWGDGEESFAVCVSVYRSALRWNGREIVEEHADESSHVITVDPPEPACDASESGEHDWINPHELVGGIAENPGVWGVGGCGIRSVDICACCGLSRVSQTATQGEETEYDHDSVSYGGDDDVSIDDLAAYHVREGDAERMLGVLREESELAEAIRASLAEAEEAS